jgi:hypothetical protein
VITLNRGCAGDNLRSPFFVDFRSANAEIEVLLREALAKRGVKVGVSETPKRGRPPKEN